MKVWLSCTVEEIELPKLLWVTLQTMVHGPRQYLVSTGFVKRSNSNPSQGALMCDLIEEDEQANIFAIVPGSARSNHRPRPTVWVSLDERIYWPAEPVLAPV